MLTIDIEVRGKIAIFSIQGEISPSTSRDFERAFEKYLSTDYSVMAIDLKKIRYIDSFGISRLVRLSRAFSGTGGEFLLVNMNDNIHQIFRMATFDKLFKILTGEQFAAAYLIADNTRDDLSQSRSRTKTETGKGTLRTVGYKHNDVTGTTLLFEEEDIAKSEK